MAKKIDSSSTQASSVTSAPRGMFNLSEYSLSKQQLRRLLPFALVLLIALLPSIYFYRQSRIAEQKLTAPSAASLQTTTEVVKRVSQHILLPGGEQPTVATVSDASKVRNQTFFANAASGDKVLIYAQAKKAYLYRPSIDRVIEVAPLAPNTPSI